MPDNQQSIFTGILSGKPIHIPNVNTPPMPAIAEPGVIYNGAPTSTFNDIDVAQGYPDVRSFQRKLGLLLPATNTTMEHELWSILLNNQDQLPGIGLHTTGVVTPSPKLATAADLEHYRQQFLSGLKTAVATALLAQPQYLLMGMSLEHIIYGLDDIRAPMTDLQNATDLSWATWHDAAPAALQKCNAKRIGLLTPFDVNGNRNAAKMFEDLGFNVVASVGFACAHAVHIAHIPDWAKERAILELLATAENKLDAIVQCGTNMSMIQVIEKLEPVVGIPILGINATLLWYALRENGFMQPLVGAGQLFHR